MRAVAKKVDPKLLLPKALGAGDAFRDRVTPAVPEEDGALLGTESAWVSAVRMDHRTAAKKNCVFCRD
jgi:hypothetical protein